MEAEEERPEVETSTVALHSCQSMGRRHVRRELALGIIMCCRTTDGTNKRKQKEKKIKIRRALWREGWVSSAPLTRLQKFLL